MNCLPGPGLPDMLRHRIFMHAQPPGLLPEASNPDVVMMICTAGHVDHGKTLLVKMLTGCSTDRLKEEQDRGMTIELGFAPCFLGGDLSVGIVDVPGHEKFVKTMVAGVSGIGLAVLVIAADDGIMPQTVEHVQIMELLGVRQGLVALTKIDLVTEEQLRQRIDEIRTFLKGTFLAEATICPLSSKTFDGYGDFYDTLVRRIRGILRQPRPGIFRMPIERVFTLSGQGTIISGIPVDGSITNGSMVEVVPGGYSGRIRGIQRFMRDASQGGYGQCLALNMPDLNKNVPARGQVLSLPGCMHPAACLQVNLVMAPGIKRSLRNAEEVKFHTGTFEENGKIYLLESQELNAGETGLATVVLNNPVAAAPHDRFILRRPSPSETLAGGAILLLSPESERPKKAQILPILQTHRSFFAGIDPHSETGVDKRVEWFLAWEKKAGASLNDISKGTLLGEEAVQRALGRLVPAGTTIQLSEGFYIHSQAYKAHRKQIEDRIREASGRELSVSIADLKKDSNWPPPLWQRIESELEKESQIRRRGDRIILSAALEKMPPQDKSLMEHILKLYQETGFQSPRPDELPEKLHAPADRINRLLGLLCNEQQLFRLTPQVVLNREHLKKAQTITIDLIRKNGMLDSADFKTHIESSRKYALAILDYFDTRRITVRNGNERKLAAGHETRLL